MRDSGGTVWFDPDLEVVYRPRSTLRGLARQYHEYGRWKRHVLARDPRSLRWRHLVAPAATVANVLGLVVGIRFRPALLVPATYLVATAVAAGLADAPAATRARLPAVFATMHHAWGLGFLRGVRPRRPSRRAQPEASR